MLRTPNVSLLGTALIMAGVVGVMLPRLKTLRSRHSTLLGLALLAVGLALHFL